MVRHSLFVIISFEIEKTISKAIRIEAHIIISLFGHSLPLVFTKQIDLFRDLFVLFAQEQLNNRDKIRVQMGILFTNVYIIGNRCAARINIGGCQTTTDRQIILPGKFFGKPKHNDSIHFIRISSDQQRIRRNNNSWLGISVEK